MARRPYAALGTVATPHGPVIVRKVWNPDRNFYFFEFAGAHLALRWMLPEWSPRAPATKTQFTPPRALATAEQVGAIFAKMAAAWEERLRGRQDLLVPTPGNSKAPYHTISQLRGLVDVEIATTLRPSTVSTYRFQWKGVLAYIPEDTPVIDITRELLQGVVSRMSGTELSAATVRKNMEALNRLLVRAVEDAVLDRNPMEKVKLPKKLPRVPRFLTAEQRFRLLEVAAEDSADAHLLIGLGVYLGLRKAELLALRWEDVDLAQRVAQVQNQEFFTTKNAKNRAVPMCGELCAILEAHRRSAGFVLRPANGYQRGKRYRWEFRGLFRALSTSAGIGLWMTPHVMRHTFASLAAQAGISLYKIGQWMGHSSSEVTEIYAHLAAYDADIDLIAPASAVQGAPPAALLLDPPQRRRSPGSVPEGVAAG